MKRNVKSYHLESTQILQQHLAEQYSVHKLADNLDNHKYWQSDIESAEPVGVTQRPPVSSAKGFFFSERENIFSFDGQCFRETLPTPEPFVLFGIHSCDLTAIAYQDQFFAEDPYYQARRQQALLVGVDCITPCENGFCPSVHAGPGVDTAFADLILHRTDNNRWLLLAASEKGEQAITGLPLESATEPDAQLRQQRIEQCKEQFSDDSHIQGAINLLLAQKVPQQFWNGVGVQCLTCSGCTSLCPTCSCYGNRELTDGTTATQQRFWDSCLYESFQREASQHNPGKLAGDRVKRFWTHKFNPQTREEFNRHGCVGCGRCEQTCPGVIGAHTIMKRMTDYVEKNVEPDTQLR